MTVTLQPITRDNWQACIRLKPAADQTHFVAPNLYSLAESKYDTSMVPLGIYAGEAMVGFLMWGQDPDDGRYWVVRLMVAEAHQGRGYGRAAMEQIIAELRQRPDCQSITLGFEPENHGAEQLYERLGFRRTGEVLDGEIISRLDF